MKFAHCFHIVLVIRKYTDNFFLGGGEGYARFYSENLHWGEKFLWVNIPGEMLLRGVGG